MCFSPVASDNAAQAKRKDNVCCYALYSKHQKCKRSDGTFTGQRNRSQFHVELDFELLDASSLRLARDGIVVKLSVCITFDSLFLVVSLDNLRLTIRRPFDPNSCNNSKVTCVLR